MDQICRETVTIEAHRIRMMKSQHYFNKLMKSNYPDMLRKLSSGASLSTAKFNLLH